MKKTILIISKKRVENEMCGILLFSELYGNAASLSEKYNILHIFVNSLDDFLEAYELYKPEIVFYNFSRRTTPWMMELNWKKKVQCKNVIIEMDATQTTADNFHPSNCFNFDYMTTIDPTIDVRLIDNVFNLNHLMPTVNVPDYIEPEITKIGFHGAPSLNKGIVELVATVNYEFDEAEIVFHCPLNYTYSGHKPDEYMQNINLAKAQITKPGIKFTLCTDLLTDQELINKLSQNTINCYFNQDSPYSVRASSTDYALAAKRPIAITKSKCNKILWNVKPSICIQDNSIKTIIANGFEPLQEIYDKFTAENVCRDFENIIVKILKPKVLSFSI